MPLRRKSSGKKNNSLTEITANVKVGSNMKERPDSIQDGHFPGAPTSQEKRTGSTRRSSLTPSEGDLGLKIGEVQSRKGSSSSSKGLARIRKTSRDCVIPEKIDLDSHPDSPKLLIEDCCNFGGLTHLKSRPINLQRVQSEDRDCISIKEMSESPHRLGEVHYIHKASPPPSKLSATLSVDSTDGMAFFPPSSPLLVAMRNAVDSLNQYEDFEILEEIGAGFFAQVFKVRPLCFSNYGKDTIDPHKMLEHKKMLTKHNTSHLISYIFSFSVSCKED